jgi:hypothetical protein
MTEELSPSALEKEVLANALLLFCEKHIYVKLFEFSRRVHCSIQGIATTLWDWTSQISFLFLCAYMAFLGIVFILFFKTSYKRTRANEIVSANENPHEVSVVTFV